MKNLFIFIVMFSYNLIIGQNINYVPGELIVQFQKGYDIYSVFSSRNFKNAPPPVIHLKSIIDADWNYHLVTFDTLKYSNSAILSLVNSWKSVLSVQLNYIAQIRNAEPNDPLYFNTQKWVMDKIHAPELWDLTTGGKTPCGDDPVIAVLDFGFDVNHEDIKENLWVNEKEIAGDGIDNDKNGYIDDVYGIIADRNDGIYEKLAHGSSCLGVIGGIGNNNKGITGINWHTKTMILGHAYTAADMIKLYSYVKNMRKLYRESNGNEGAFVVATSMSLGFNNGDPNSNALKPLCDVYDLLGEEGILNVTATTNSNENVDVIKVVTSLCQSDYLIVVTSTNINDDSFRGYSMKNVDLAAPGEKVGLLNIDNTYYTGSGTSFATPLVAGAIGLYYSLPNLISLCEEVKIKPKVTPLVIKNAILNSVSKVPSLSNRTYSGGMLNIWEGAKELIKNYNIPSIVDNRIEKIFYKNVSGNLFVDFDLTDFNDPSIEIFNILGQSIYFKNITYLEFINGKLEIENFLNSGLLIGSIKNRNNKNSKLFFLK